MKALPHPNKQKGAVLVLVTVALFVLLGFTALALDGGYLILNKNRLQDAVDAAALSGGKTLSLTDEDKNTQAEAEKAVRETLKAIFQGEGFQKMNVDTTKLAETVAVEFSLKPVPFDPIDDPTAKYLRVRMETVPVTQFFSQLMVDVWQVRASAVVGSLAPEKGTEICDVVPLLMLVDQNDVGTEGYGYKMASAEEPGDIMVIKSPAAGEPNMAPGHFQALRLGEQKGADAYREGLASGYCISLDEDYEVDECKEGDSNCTLTVTNGEQGNMAGPTRQGLNTRFNIYNPGKFKKPLVAPDDPNASESDFYSDCTLSKSGVLDFKDNNLVGYLEVLLNDGSTTKDEMLSLLSEKKEDSSLKANEVKAIDDYIKAINGMQLYSDYKNPLSERNKKYEVKGNDHGCLDSRRIVKVPVAVGGEGVGKNIPVIGVACIFLNQQVTGNGLSQYIVGELIPECGADGDGTDDDSGFSQPRLVLYNDTGSEDS
ncbi:Tad domain-containing protein [Oceanimonas pelagia]|uniref:Tad domain-containing protein n=1 Tax=Oceanimonas pelagia TaxID=3028314 RepID=A0AA50QD77_9GAMM|nr:TadE/TadG family type IV pilus assembly protein [Oceanimonas pelagia]WMC11891.1 Tad domain-containing protein [Oceanimonas pelagia]